MPTDHSDITRLETAQEFTEKHVEALFNRLRELQDGQKRIEIFMGSMTELPQRVATLEKEASKTSTRLTTLESRRECPNPSVCLELKSRVESVEQAIKEVGKAKVGVASVWEFLKVIGSIVIGLSSIALALVEIWRLAHH